jgi:hypothetical protein
MILCIAFRYCSDKERAPIASDLVESSIRKPALQLSVLGLVPWCPCPM